MTIAYKRETYKVGDKVRAVNVNSFKNTEVAPPLTLQEDYIVRAIVMDRKGYQHLDVGLPSEYNYITSQETGEELRNGDKIHWCNPSRFIKIK